jgi:hypothetical protein
MSPVGQKRYLPGRQSLPLASGKRTISEAIQTSHSGQKATSQALA